MGRKALESQLARLRKKEAQRLAALRERERLKQMQREIRSLKYRKSLKAGRVIGKGAEKVLVGVGKVGWWGTEKLAEMGKRMAEEQRREPVRRKIKAKKYSKRKRRRDDSGFGFNIPTSEELGLRF